MNLHPDLFLTFAGVGVCIPGAHRAHRGPRQEILRQAEVNSGLTFAAGAAPRCAGPPYTPGSGRGDEVK